MRNEVKEYKRSRIVEEASKLFYERGFDGTSVDMLANELGVTKPFIYSYFDNKRSILEAVYEQAAARVLRHIESAAKSEGPPDQRLRRFLDLYVSENIDEQIASAIYLQEEKNVSPAALQRVRAIERSFNKKLAQLIQEGIDAKVFEVTDAKLASLCISGMVRWVHRWYKRDGRLSRQDISVMIADLGMNLIGFRGGEPKKNSRSRRPR